MVATTSRYRDVFAVPEFRALYGAFTLHTVGDTMKMLALSGLVFERTNSPLLAAIAYAAGFLPYVVGGTLLLSLADRMRPRPLLVAFHIFRLALTALLAIGGLPIPAAIAVLALTGLFAPVANAASNGMLPDLLPGESYVLGRSLFTMSAGGSQIVGFAAGGSLLVTIGANGTLWLATASCLLTALVVRFGLRDHPARAISEASPIRATMQVNRRLLADRTVRPLLLVQWLPISLAVGAEGVIIPYAAGLDRPGSAGIILAVMAGGMLIGNLVMGRFVSAPGRERLLLPLALLVGAPLVLFPLDIGLPVAAALGGLAAFGFSYELSLQRRFIDAVPTANRGQALGLASTGLMTGQASGVMIAGAFGEFWSPATVIAFCGMSSMAATLVLVGRLRGLGRVS